MPRASKAAVKKRLKELDAREEKAKRKPWDPLAALCGPDGCPYADQQAVFLDPRPDRVFEGTRQTGKSTEAAVELIDVALKKPGSESVFLDFDITHAEKILLRDFERLLGEYEIAAKIIDGELRFDNGSIVYIFSGRPAEIKKLQGLKLALLVTDESHDAEALEAIFKLCRPALIRHNGRILAMGIPGRIAGIGFWWDITHGDKAKRFGQHRGDMRRNPWLDEEARNRLLETAKEESGENSPDFLRHWMGQWPANDNALRAFRYFPDVNGFDAGEEPVCKFHSLGLDPGGVLDAEAVETIGHGNGDGSIWQVDEDVSEKREGGDWDVTGMRVGPQVERWHPETLFMDYGSVRKSGLIVKYKLDTTISLDAVPPKDPEQEAVRINQLFQARRLKIRRGSKLHFDLLYTTLDAKELAKGKWVLSKAWKQNAVDALRAALWGVEGYVHLAPSTPLRPTDEQREAMALKKIHESKPKPPTVATAADRILGRTNRTLSDAVGRPPSSRPPPANLYGIKR